MVTPSVAPDFAEREPIDFWLPVTVLFTNNILLFFVCWYLKDNSWIDMFWAFTLLFPIISVIIAKAARGLKIANRSFLILAMVSVWGIRLALHIFCRHKGEDFRYADMRKRWMKRGFCYYNTMAFFSIFILQGIFSLITNSSCLYTLIYSPQNEFKWTDYAGILVWSAGLIIETVADH